MIRIIINKIILKFLLMYSLMYIISLISFENILIDNFDLINDFLINFINSGLNEVIYNLYSFNPYDEEFEDLFVNPNDRKFYVPGYNPNSDIPLITITDLNPNNVEAAVSRFSDYSINSINSINSNNSNNSINSNVKELFLQRKFLFPAIMSGVILSIGGIIATVLVLVK